MLGMADDRGVHPTIQDDRAALEADPGEGSNLTQGEGAPLAQDDAVGVERDSGIVSQAFVGGAPVGIGTDLEPSFGGPGAGGDLMATPDDRPIGD